MNREKILRRLLAMTVATMMSVTTPLLSFADGDSADVPETGGSGSDESNQGTTADQSLSDLGASGIVVDDADGDKGGNSTADAKDVSVADNGEDLSAGQTAAQDSQILESTTNKTTEYYLDGEKQEASSDSETTEQTAPEGTLDYVEVTTTVDQNVETVHYITDADGKYISGTAADGSSVDKIEVSSADAEATAVQVITGEDGAIRQVSENDTVVTGTLTTTTTYYIGETAYETKEAAEAAAIGSGAAVDENAITSTTDDEVTTFTYNGTAYDTYEAAYAAAQADANAAAIEAAGITANTVTVFTEGQGQTYVVDAEGNYANTTTVYYIDSIVRDAEGNIVYNEDGSVKTEKVEISAELAEALKDGSLEGDNYSVKDVYMITDVEGNQVAVNASDFTEGTSSLEVTTVDAVTGDAVHATVDGKDVQVTGDELTAVQNAAAAGSVTANSDGSYTVTVNGTSYTIAASESGAAGIVQTQTGTDYTYSGSITYTETTQKTSTEKKTIVEEGNGPFGSTDIKANSDGTYTVTVVQDNGPNSHPTYTYTDVPASCVTSVTVWKNGNQIRYTKPAGNAYGWKESTEYTLTSRSYDVSTTTTSSSDKTVTINDGDSYTMDNGTLTVTRADGTTETYTTGTAGNITTTVKSDNLKTTATPVYKYEVATANETITEGYYYVTVGGQQVIV